MFPMLKQCEEQAMRLAVAERAVLAQHLISSLDELDTVENERLWAKEAEVRYAAHISAGR